MNEQQLRASRALMRNYRNLLRRMGEMVAGRPGSRLASADREVITRALAALEADFRATDPAFRDALTREAGAEALGLARGRWDGMRSVLAAATATVQAQPWYARLFAAAERAALGFVDGSETALSIFAGGTIAVALIVVVLAFVAVKR